MHIRTLSLVGLLVFVSGCARTWTDFRGDVDRFTTRFPGEVKLQTVTTAGQDVRLYSTTVSGGVAQIAVSSIDPKLIATDEDQFQLMDQLRQAMLVHLQAKPHQGDPVPTVGHVSVIQTHVNADISETQQRLRAHLYLTNGRFYQVIVIGGGNWVQSADATNFLESFKIDQTE